MCVCGGEGWIVHTCFLFSSLLQFVILEIFSITGYHGENPLPFRRCSSYFLITCSCSCFPDFNCHNHKKEKKKPKPKKKTPHKPQKKTEFCRNDSDEP